MLRQLKKRVDVLSNIPRQPEQEEVDRVRYVRRVETQGDTRSIGIELIGLSDADIDELVKVTNLDAVVSRKERQEQSQAEAPEDTPVLAQVAAEEQ